MFKIGQVIMLQQLLGLAFSFLHIFSQMNQSLQFQLKNLVMYKVHKVVAKIPKG